MEGFVFEKEIVKAIPKLKRLGMRLTYDPIRTEDLVQETLLKALVKKDYFKTDTSGSITSWLCRILRNHFIDQHRASKKHVLTRIEPGEEHSLVDRTNYTHLACEYDAQLIQEVVDHSSADHKAILQLRMDGYTYEEITALLDIPMNTVKTRIYHGRQKLIARLTKLGVLPSNAA